MNLTMRTPKPPPRIIHYSPGMRLELGGVVRSVLDWCTVLTTRGTDIWQDIAAAGGTIAQYTPTAISAALDKLLEDRSSPAAQGQRGREWVMRNLNTEKLAGDYERL
jgi:hypothetical protein